VSLRKYRKREKKEEEREREREREQRIKCPNPWKIETRQP
jgi:hypothetical protein